jgi:hypothetical protein
VTTPPEEDTPAFQVMVVAYVKNLKIQPSKFVKKLDEMPKVSLSPSSTRNKEIFLANRGLIGQFIGIRPSSEIVSLWLEKNWKPFIKCYLNHFFCERGLFAFLFEHKEDEIRWSGPYFMGGKGMYLNKWTPEFTPENDVSLTIPVWVRLPHILSTVGAMMFFYVLGILLEGMLIGLSQRKIISLV